MFGPDRYARPRGAIGRFAASLRELVLYMAGEWPEAKATNWPMKCAHGSKNIWAHITLGPAIIANWSSACATC